MSTRAIRLLTRAGIPFEVLIYTHVEKGARCAAEATGVPLEQTVKTLVVALEEGRHALALMSGDRQLSTRRLARALGVKRAAMAQGADAERLTGYKLGGISPFGTQRRLPVVMAQELLRHPWVLINAGQRGSMLRMAPEEIRRALAAQVAEIGE
jgi:Cys-tRNA(Pro)/Cys-tRNA(Cys) deacylase